MTSSKAETFVKPFQQIAMNHPQIKLCAKGSDWALKAWITDRSCPVDRSMMQYCGNKPCTAKRFPEMPSCAKGVHFTAFQRLVMSMN